MNTAPFIFIFTESLHILEDEIRNVEQEEMLWQVVPGVSNSAGNLTLHLVGNLNHFIGATLGNTGYVRQRDKEFSTKNVPKTEMLDAIAAARQTVEKVLAALTDANLGKTYPLETFGPGRTTHFVLVRLMAHFHYHLGQINYLRRILSGAK